MSLEAVELILRSSRFFTPHEWQKYVRLPRIRKFMQPGRRREMERGLFGEFVSVPAKPFPECVARVPVSLWGSGG